MSKPSPTLAAIAIVLTVAAGFVLSPFWVALLLAAWFADLLAPLTRWLARILGGRRRAAGALIVLVTLAIVLPVVGVVMVVISEIRGLEHQVWAAFANQPVTSTGPEGVASALPVFHEVSSQAVPAAPNTGLQGPFNGAFMQSLVSLVTQHGATLWSTLLRVVSASTYAVVGLALFGVALYTLVVDGKTAYQWLEKTAPVSPTVLARLTGAFRETGRGLIVAEGGIALCLGVLATVVYFAIGIPRAGILGPITGVCSLIPLLGTALVWVPLTIQLALTHQFWRAGVVLVMGAAVYGLVDNVLRPILSRYGRLQLPVVLILVSMFGGMVLWGAAGALLGPLVVRLCKEALAIWAEQRDSAASVPCEVPPTATPLQLSYRK